MRFKVQWDEKQRMEYFCTVCLEPTFHWARNFGGLVSIYQSSMTDFVFFVSVVYFKKTSFFAYSKIKLFAYV